MSLLKNLYASSISAAEFNATNELNNQYSYEEFLELAQRQQDQFDSVDDYEHAVSESEDEDYDDKEGRRLLLSQQQGDRPKSKFDIKNENLRILAELKAGYKSQRLAFSDVMISERVLTRTKYPTITLHWLELFPRLSRVPIALLQAFKSDFNKGFNSGLSSRISARPDRSSSDPSRKNMENFHKWIQTVDLEAVQSEMVAPARLSVVKTTKRAKFTNHHITTSQLNGNNGEVTGEDDHPKRLDIAGLAAAVGEGYIRPSHKKKTGEPPKNSKLLKPCKTYYATGDCPFGDNCKFTHSERKIVESDDSISAPSLVPFPEPTQDHYVSDTHISWDGVHVYIDGVSSCGLVSPTRQGVGTELEGTGCGWHVTVHNPKTKNCRVHQLVDPVVRHKIQAQYYLGNWIPGFDGLVFQPALERIVREIPPLGVIDEAKNAAALAIMARNFSGLPDYLISNTYTYWSLRNLFFKRNTLKSTTTSRMLAQDKVEFLKSQYNSAIMSQVYRDNHISYNTITWLPIPASECKVVPPAILKRTFSSRCKGVEWDKNSANPYPVFLTQSKNYRWYTTQMCRFEGHGAAFVVYDNIPTNMSLAMKRLIAAREGEESLYSAQLWLVMQLAYRTRPSGDLPNMFFQPGYNHSTYLDPAVLSWCKCFPKFPLHSTNSSMPIAVRIGDTQEYHDVAFTSEQLSGSVDFPDYVLDAIMRPCNRTSRSHLETIYDALLNKTTKTYYRVYEAYTEFLDAHGARNLAANIDHIKIRLRQSYVKGVLLHLDEDCMVKSLTACVKREFAKAGKVPRLFIDYAKGCMYAGELPEWVKECMNGAYHFSFPSLQVRIYIFAKPKASILADELTNLINSTTRSENNYNVLLFSDDSVHAGRVNGVSFAYNVDITSTDSSNSTLVFALTAAALAKFNSKRAKGLVAQCCRPILLVNPVERSEQITIQFHGPFEGSGTVLTTILNHTASYVGAILAAYFISRSLQDTNSEVSFGMPTTIASAIQLGYHHAGHLVTCEECGAEEVIIPEKIQFLKRSPIWNGQRWIPTLNLGCILRSLGTLENDIQPAQIGLETIDELKLIPWEDRMDMFISGVVRGYVHEPDNVILSALRNRFSVGVHITDERTVLGREIEWDLDQASGGDASAFNESLAKRYDLTMAELTELAAHIGSIAIGGVSVTQAATNIYKVDYGLESATTTTVDQSLDLVYEPRQARVNQFPAI